MPWRGFQLAAPLPFWRRRAASVVALPNDAESVVCFMSTVASSRRGVLSAGPVARHSSVRGSARCRLAGCVADDLGRRVGQGVPLRRKAGAIASNTSSRRMK
jgi:hypothetical protein